MTDPLLTVFKRSVFMLTLFGSTAAFGQTAPPDPGEPFRRAAEAALLAGRPDSAAQFAWRCASLTGDATTRATCATTQRVATLAARPSPWRPGPGPLALASAGAVGLLLSGVYAGLTAQALAGCAVAGGHAQCPTPGALAVARRFGDYTAANVALGVSLTALAAATAWWLVASLTAAPPPRLGLAVDPTGGLALVGRF